MTPLITEIIWLDKTIQQWVNADKKWKVAVIFKISCQTKEFKSGENLVLEHGYTDECFLSNYSFLCT